MSDQLHFEILPPAQKRAWQLLTQHSKQLSDSGFYLAGGTALSLQIGHRQSIDFDFFSPKATAAAKTLAWVEKLPGWQLRDQAATTVHGEVGTIKISLISGYKFPTIDELIITQEGIHLATIREIGAMKLLAITHRAVVRDYLDIAVIIRDYHSLEELLGLAEQKHGPKFNRLLPLRALVSFDELTGEWPRLFDKTIKGSWEEIVRQAVKKVA